MASASGRIAPVSGGGVVSGSSEIAKERVRLEPDYFIILLILRNPVNPVYLSRGGAVFVEWFDTHDPSV
jgi:hypothetical protein